MVGCPLAYWLWIGLAMVRVSPVYGQQGPGPDGQPAADGGAGNGQQADVEVMDLNEIDLEQAEESWENLPAEKAADITDSVKVDEIVEPSSEYRYSSFGKPDPFRKPQVTSSSPMGQEEKGNQTVSGAEIPIISPLQAYPLEDLDVKGVWVLGNGQTRAIIMTPKKEGIVVKEGDPIAAGKVMNIERTKLVVRQYSVREDGVREFEDLEISIGRNQDRKKGFIRLNPGKDPEFVNFNDDAKVEAAARAKAAEQAANEKPPVNDRFAAPPQAGQANPAGGNEPNGVQAAGDAVRQQDQ
jgi:Tfp pilus assembly protein PilP